MKTLPLVLIGAALSTLFPYETDAQVYNQRRLIRPVAPQLQTNPPTPPQATSAVPRIASPAPLGTNVLRPRATQPVVRVIRPVVNPEHARAAREEALRRTVAFQMKRADEGSESAQYELGLRYLKGDGVEQDEAKGRHWLTVSAKNGYGPAARKLQALDKAAEPPK